jgi:hypothetical protein
MGLFQKTSDPALAAPNIKFASDYSSLNAAFSSLQEGDILFVNSPSNSLSTNWYTLPQTAEITQRNVQIIGMGGRIRPTSNGGPSPLIRIKNISNGPGGARQKLLTNIVISGLRIENDKASTGQGTGVGIEILDDYQNVPDGNVWHIRLDDIYVENFSFGIKITNAFDIVLNNCAAGQSTVGLRCEVTNNNRVVGQVRLFGGHFLSNSYHISLDGIPNSQFGQIQAFGITCAGQRFSVSGGAEGIFLGKWTQGTMVFGCHFEDLAHGIVCGSGVTTPSGSYSEMSLAVIGCTFHRMRVPGAGIDTNATSSQLASLISIGNNYGPNDNTSQFYNTPRFFQGILIGGNTQNSNLSQSYPGTGYIEHTPAANKNAFRLSSFTNATRPPANAVPVGTSIFNTTTWKLNISDGTNWRDANGNFA